MRICECIERRANDIGFKVSYENIDDKGFEHIPQINNIMIKYCPFCGTKILNLMLPECEPCESWEERKAKRDRMIADMYGFW